MVNSCRKTFGEFIAFAKTLRTRTIHDAIKDAVPIGPIHRFGFPAVFGDTLRRLDSFPDRLLPLGDVICRFNPAFGQGMSVAAQEVGVLKRLIEARTSDADPLKGLAQSFFAAIQDFLAAPWAVAESDFIYEKTRGQRPNDFHQRLKFNLRVAAGRFGGCNGASDHERGDPSGEADPALCAIRRSSAG